MPVAVQSCAERFAANWKAQNPTDKEEEQTSLDDSLTNLQWLHSINISGHCANDYLNSSFAEPVVEFVRLRRSQ